MTLRRRKGRPGYYGSYRAENGKWREVKLPGNKVAALKALTRLEIRSWAIRHGLTPSVPAPQEFTAHGAGHRLIRGQTT